jgi:hypothetical protein
VHSSVELVSWQLNTKAVKEYKPLSGASIAVYKGSAVVSQVSSDGRGEFTVDVPANGEYVIVVSYQGCNSKRIAVSTIGVPEDRAKDNYRPGFDIVGGFTMAKPFPTVGYSILQQPLTKVMFNPNNKKFDYDKGLTESMLSELEKLAVAENVVIDKFTSANRAGDEALAKGDCPAAKMNYEKAISVLPDEEYPKTRLPLVDQCMKDKEDAAKKAAEQAEADRLAKEKAAADKAAAEKLAAEKAAAEKAAAEKAAAEKAEADRLAKEEAAKKAAEKAEADRIAKEKAAAEKAEADRIAKEKAAADKAAAEKLAAEKAAADKAAAEKAAAEKAEADRIAKEKAAADKAAADKAAAEKAESDRIAREKAAAEKAAADKLAAEKAAAEKIEREKAAKEKIAADKAAKEKAAADKVAKEKELLDKKAAEKAEQDRIAREKAAEEKAAREKAAAEKAAADKLAQEKMEGKIIAKDKETIVYEPRDHDVDAKHRIPTALGKDKYKEGLTKAEGYFKMKRYAEAKTAYEELLKLKPGDPYATNKLVEIEKLMNAPKPAK